MRKYFAVENSAADMQLSPKLSKMKASIPDPQNFHLC